MKNGNPLAGLRIVENDEERNYNDEQGINQINNQRILINLQRQVMNRENNDEENEQINPNQINNSGQMDIIEN